MTRPTWRASVSSLPTPFITDATAPFANAWAVASIACSACIALVATMPKSHGGRADGVARGVQARVHLARAREPQAVALDRVDVRLVEVEGPHLDVVERGQVGGEERPHGAAADDADPHEPVPSVVPVPRRRSPGSDSSRPPVSPPGLMMSTAAMSTPTTTSRVPAGRSIGDAGDREAVLGLGEQRVEAGDRERTDDGAPEARHAADDEHGERDERQVEVDEVDVQRQQVDVEPAGEPGHGAGETEGDQPLPVHGDADGAGRRRVLAGGAQLAPVAAALVGEGDGDRDQGGDPRLDDVGRLGHRREHVQPGPDLLVVAEDVARDLEHREGRDAGREPGEPHQRQAGEQGEHAPDGGGDRAATRRCRPRRP